MSFNPERLFCSAGVLKREDLYLIAERPKGKPFAGLWEFPGGKMHPHETPSETLARELYEELGIILEISSLQKIMDVSYTYPDFELFMPTFLCQRWEGEPQGCEGQRLQWVSLQDLSRYEVLPASIAIVKTLQERFATK